MTARQLIKLYKEHQPDGHFFDKATLAFFGERISEMKVEKDQVVIQDFYGNDHSCYVTAMLIAIICLLIAGAFPAVAQANTERASDLTYKVVQLKPGRWKTVIYHNSHKLYSYKTAWKPKVKVIADEDLTYRKLVNRQKNHVIYVSYFYGRCINNEKDGEIITDSLYNYTSYRDAENVKKGDLVKTYLVYNPHTAYEDDIIDRIDTVIG